MNRRESLKLIAIASLAAAFPGCTQETVNEASRKAQASGTGGLEGRKPTQLSDHEFATVTLLANYIIPADDRSGSASDAEVPAFIDFMMEDAPELQDPMHSGLTWLDGACNERYGASFTDANADLQIEMLDSIAYPDMATDNMKDGVAFFTTMRDLTASGFWSSRMGMEDLDYTGNRPQGSWEGCSHEAMAYLGLSYESE